MAFRFMMFLAVTVLTVAGCSSERAGTSASRMPGWQLKLGDGTVSSYAELEGGGAPTSIGVVWSSSALDALPNDADEHRCFGRTKDGAIDAGTKCQHTHEFVIPLPDAVSRRADIPFKWVLFNWNPVGHIPPGIYDAPHFDIHFEMGPIADAFAIESGPCGPELVRCDQFTTARKPLPPNYLPPDYVDVEAVVPVMGNHLIDTSGPEFHQQPFTRSWRLHAEQAQRLPADQSAEGGRRVRALSDGILRASQRDNRGVFGVDGEVLASRCERSGGGSIEG